MCGPGEVATEAAGERNGRRRRRPAAAAAAAAAGSGIFLGRLGEQNPSEREGELGGLVSVSGSWGVEKFEETGCL